MRLILLAAMLTCLTETVFAASPGLDSHQQTAVAWVDDHADDLWRASRTVWENPEIGLEESISSATIAGLLERDGFTVTRGVAGMPTAFVAEWGSGAPVIGFLGEYDALPGLSQEAGQTTLAPVLTGAPGHGCGHSIFGVASAGAALALKAAMEANHIPGTVKMFGCPAEETVIGKVYMARDGVFDGLDGCLSWHPGTTSMARPRKSLALNNFTVAYRGRTAHAAGSPWSGRSALDAVELLNYSVNQMREHVKPTVRMHYVIPNGGVAPNVVPEYARVWYFVRDVNRSGVDHVYDRVVKAAEAAALATETTHEVALLTGVHELNENTALARAMYDNFTAIGAPAWTAAEQTMARGIQNTLGLEETGMYEGIEDWRIEERYERGGSTDVAEVTYLTPTAQMRVAAAPQGTPGHHWSWVACVGSSIGRKALLTAAKVMGATGVQMMTDADLMRRAREEFDETTGGTPYQSPVPAGQPVPTELPH